MLWFRNKEGLLKCVEKFNAQCDKPEDRIIVLEGSTFHKITIRKPGKRKVRVYTGFNDNNVGRNLNFENFMNETENYVYLESNPPQPRVNTSDN
jgi:hypothetical protein